MGYDAIVEERRNEMMQTINFFLVLLFLSLYESVAFCNEVECDSLLSFYQSISAPPFLNWSQTTSCCQWQGVHCSSHDGTARVTRLNLQDKQLSGTINASFLANLPFLTHINLSHNHFSGPLLLHSSLPLSIQKFDVSSNRFSSSFHPNFLHQAFNLITFNISNNTFTGSIPSSLCYTSKLIKILDFSMNQFTGPISPCLLGECPNLEVFRAGANSLSGSLPYDLYNATTLKEISLPNNQFSGPINNTIVNLSNLTILDLNSNQLSGEIPRNIGLLSNLEKLVLHTNSLSGSLHPSLMNCSKLKVLLLNSNHFVGKISLVNFSKFHQLQVTDLGGNNFTGDIPQTLCSCSSLVAVRLSRNQLVGEIPPCMASLNSLQHLALGNNKLSNIVGALKILRHCRNLVILIFKGSFHDEIMPGDNDLMPPIGFQDLKILALEDCSLRGHIPSWMTNLTKLEFLNLSKNKISGQVPSWLRAMPSLLALNLTQNLLSGHLPRELGLMPALISNNATSTSDMSYLLLPITMEGNQYTRLYNLRRALAVGSNSLSGRIPPEIGALKLLQTLDLSNNNFTGNIPAQISSLTNLEILNISRNQLSGKIPESMRGLNFLSRLNLANNDLEGEIPRGGQFDTFPVNSFEGNPKLCGYALNKSCKEVVVTDNQKNAPAEKMEKMKKESEIAWYGLPFGLGYSVGVVAVAIALLLKRS